MTAMTDSFLLLTSVKRVHGQAILTLSNGETLKMPRALLKERPYRAGVPFDRAGFDAFMQARSYPFAMEKAVALLATRARTEQEIATALRQNAYPEEAIARVMARLLEAGYLSDSAFAEQWASSRAAKGLGAHRIRMELRQKGIESDEIDHALSHMDDTLLREGAWKAAQKAARGKDLSLPAERQKVLAALARRGFDYSLAKACLQRLLEE